MNEEFFLVCAWDQYYPASGIRNIKYVTTDKDLAQELAAKLKQPESYYDYVEVFSSYNLCWVEPPKNEDDDT